jgi:hypothetical protein
MLIMVQVPPVWPNEYFFLFQWHPLPVWVTIKIFSLCLETCPTAVDAQTNDLSVSNIHFMDYNIQQCLISCQEKKTSSYVVQDA